VTGRSASEQSWRTLGELLKAARVEAGLTQPQAAKIAGFTRNTWSVLELGRRRNDEGEEVPPNTEPHNIVAAANAVQLDPAVALRTVGIDPGRHLPPARRPTVSVQAMAAKAHHLRPDLLEIVNQLVDKLAELPASDAPAHERPAVPMAIDFPLSTPETRGDVPTGSEHEAEAEQQSGGS
jgi:DNA-binding XRE family transcriptional regulator